jgi:hypothetical protein
MGLKVEPEKQIEHYSEEAKQRDILTGIAKDIHKSSF